MPYVNQNESLSSLNISSKEYDYFRKLVYNHCRINLGDNKKELVMARVSKRLRACNIPNYKSYISLLEGPRGDEEFGHLIDAISTNHTFFFRETAHFDFLKQVILPGYRNTGGPFKIWSAACSSGEEPYSIAIMLSEFFGTAANKWRIDCSDISTKVLQKAANGIFTKERLSKVDRSQVARYFQKGSGEWEDHFRAKPALRNNMTFQQVNLMNTFPFNEPFDLIFCRNVMIYFDKETQEELVNRMIKHLKPGGYLFIGHAESLTNIKHPLKTIKPAIYQLK